MPEPKVVDPIQDILDDLDSHYDFTVVRDEAGKRVVRRLRGNFQEFGPYTPGTFNSDNAVTNCVRQFWWDQRKVLFDPSEGDPSATIQLFVVSAASGQLAIVKGQQVEVLPDIPPTTIEVTGAVLTARIAARPCNMWQLDGFDNSLVAGAPLHPGFLPVDTDAAAAAAKAVFGRADIEASSSKTIKRFFSDSVEAKFCRRIAFPAQRRLVGKWKRGAIVYWPVERDAKQPYYVEPDGSYAEELPGNTGPYHGAPTNLYVQSLIGPAGQQQARDGQRRPRQQRYELVDDTFCADNGPVIRTGRFSRNTIAAVEPFRGNGWHNDAACPSRSNPGVATDAHAFAHEVVGALLDMRNRNGVTGSILPDPLRVAVQAFPAAQPGEWRKSSSTVVIANADDSLPRSWIKRWSYCSDKTVVAHEIAHALAYECCTFDYSLESGALDEALADLFAVLINNTRAIFDLPWIREDTRYVDAAPALRDASWAAFRPNRLSPNDLVERGDYPNHYADYYKLSSSIARAVRLVKPKNDHGYIHWNCAIVTRALAMLAQQANTLLEHPETGQKAVAIGPNYVGNLVFCALQLILKDRLLTNSDTAETPFAQFRSALLNVATSTQFDGVDGAGTDRRLFAAQLVNVFNAAGIGPVLSVRGRPAGVPQRYMPEIRLNPAHWVMKLEQGGTAEYWNPGDAGPISIVRADVILTTQIANLGVSSDRAVPNLTALLEIERDLTSRPTKFKAFDAQVDGERLASGEVMAQSLTIPADDLPEFNNPFVFVMATDQWNALRGSATARVAIAAAWEGRSFELPLNATLLQLQIA